MSNLESEKKMIDCQVFIKTLPVPHTSNWDLKKTAMEDSYKKLAEDYYRIVNQVVDLGGIICLDKYKLDRDDFTKIAEPNLLIKIPASALSIIQGMKMVQSCNVVIGKQ